MSADGERLILHVMGAKAEVLLCAPFIKAPVLSRLLNRISSDIKVEIVTRWHLEEVLAGVSDLSVFEIAANRPNTVLKLIDRLHAKIYVADQNTLVGSANLTATALGWSENKNLELLLEVPKSNPEIQALLEKLKSARLATLDEKNSLQQAAEQFRSRSPEIVITLPEARSMTEEEAELWLPNLPDPAKLFRANDPAMRDRLTTAAQQAADQDLTMLGIPQNTDERLFYQHVRSILANRPVVLHIAQLLKNDVEDKDIVHWIESIRPSDDIPAAVRWQILQGWLTYFLGDRFELVPNSYVMRLRPNSNGKR